VSRALVFGEVAMKFSHIGGAIALVAGLIAAPEADALSWTKTHVYGNQAGQVDPSGTDALFDGFVRVSDQQPGPQRFSDTFDFSSVGFVSIDKISLTLEFEEAGPRFGSFLGFSFCVECWDLRVPGDPSSFTGGTGSGQDVFARLDDDLSPQTFVFDLSTDVSGVNAFSKAVTEQKLLFGFSENSSRADVFDLKSATVEVHGAIPLPAGAWLMLSFIGGFGLLRRLKARVAA
jgi:hypothetical protein